MSSNSIQLSELVADRKNARRRTRRGQELIQHSLKEFGAGRSILIDRNGQIIAGNGVIENAAAAGITDVEIVPSDGSKIIAVQRTDLDLDADEKARQLAIADNRTGELAEWIPESLGSLAGLDLKPFFTDSEFLKVTASDGTPEPGSKSGEIDVDGFEFSHTCPKCHFQFND